MEPNRYRVSISFSRKVTKICRDWMARTNRRINGKIHLTILIGNSKILASNLKPRSMPTINGKTKETNLKANNSVITTSLSLIADPTPPLV